MEKIAIAYRKDTEDIFSKSVVDTIKFFGYEPFFLPQIKANCFEYIEDKLSVKYKDNSGALSLDSAEKLKACPYSETNVEDALKGVSCVVFTGGEDISPSLYLSPKKPENNGEEFNAERDVSDYILMKYCLKHNIKVFAVCRGFQLMAILFGYSVIQDLEAYFKSKKSKYDFSHRDVYKKTYVNHSLTVNKGTQLYKILGCDKIDNIPSWHHQAVIGDSESAYVSAFTKTLGQDIIEGIELKDCDFALGVQFHLESIIEDKLKGLTVDEKGLLVAKTFFSKVFKELTK